MKLFVGSGTTAGAMHKLAHAAGTINNQDAVREIIFNDKSIGGVICDGCGDTPHSDIGSRFAAINIAKLIELELIVSKGKSINWDNVNNKILRLVKDFADGFCANGESIALTLQNYFSFTVMIGLVLESEFVVAVCGDGVYMVDNEVYNIKNPRLEATKPGEAPLLNAPPYLVYNLNHSRYDNQYPGLCLIHEIFRKNLSEVKKGVVVGSDGLFPLINADRESIYHPIFTKNPVFLNQWLAGEVYSQTKTSLGDDISCIVIRTEEIQKKLEAERSEVGNLLNVISELKKELSTTKADLERTKSDLVLARRTFGAVGYNQYATSRRIYIPEENNFSSRLKSPKSRGHSQVALGLSPTNGRGAETQNSTGTIAPVKTAPRTSVAINEKKTFELEIVDDQLASAKKSLM